MEFSIATLNVHMWVDGDWNPNYDRVLKLIKVKVNSCFKDNYLKIRYKNGNNKFSPDLFHFNCRKRTQTFYVYKNVVENTT